MILLFPTQGFKDIKEINEALKLVTGKEGRSLPPMEPCITALERSLCTDCLYNGQTRHSGWTLRLSEAECGT